MIPTAFILIYTYLPENKDFSFPNSSSCLLTITKWNMFCMYTFLKAEGCEGQLSYIQENIVYDSDTGL